MFWNQPSSTVTHLHKTSTKSGLHYSESIHIKLFSFLDGLSEHTKLETKKQIFLDEFDSPEYLDV